MPDTFPLPVQPPPQPWCKGDNISQYMPAPSSRPKESGLTTIVSKRKGQILGALGEVEGTGQLTMKVAASMTGVVALLAVDLALHGLRTRAANFVAYLLATPKEGSGSMQPPSTNPCCKLPGGGGPAGVPMPPNEFPYCLDLQPKLETRMPERLEVGIDPRPAHEAFQKFINHPLNPISASTACQNGDAKSLDKLVAHDGAESKSASLEPGEIPNTQPSHILDVKPKQPVYGMANKGIDLDKGKGMPF